MRDKRIVEVVKANPTITINELTEEFNRPRATIYRWLKHYNIELEKTSKVGSLNIDELKLLYYSGYKINDILNKFDISRTTFYSILDELDLPNRSEFVEANLEELAAIYQKMNMKYDDNTSMIVILSAVIDNMTISSSSRCVVVSKDEKMYNRIVVHLPNDVVNFEQIINRAHKLLVDIKGGTALQREIDNYPNLIIVNTVFNIYNSFIVCDDINLVYFIADMLYPNFEKGDVICISALINSVTRYLKGTIL